MTELAGVTRNGVLVSEKEWQTHVESLRKVSSTPDISAELSQAIRVRLEWAGGRRVGVFLSGGLDSALLAMLNSCSSGVGVVNIDNGFGAAHLACLILRGRRPPAAVTVESKAP